MKKVVSACVDQILKFDSEQEIENFLKLMEIKNQKFRVMWKTFETDGNILIRVRKQYNNNELMVED